MTVPTTEASGPTRPSAAPDEPVHPGAVWALVDGLASWSAAAAAVDLDLFAHLAEHPDGMSVADLATACGAPADRLDVLGQALVAIGLLVHRDGTYALAPVAARYLVPGRPEHLGALLRRSPGVAANWPALPAVVRGATPPHPVDADDEFASGLADATFELQRATASALPAVLGLDRSADLHVVDLGSGGGAWSRGLLDELPTARATLVDRAPLHAVARRHLAAAAEDGGPGPGERARLVELDLAEAAADAPRAVGEPADLVVLAHVLRLLPPAAAEQLVAAAASMLRPHGTVVVADYLLDAPSPARERAAVLGLVTLANTEAGRLVTRPQLDGWLTAAGLAPARPLGLSPVFSVLVASPAEPPT